MTAAAPGPPAGAELRTRAARGSLWIGLGALVSKGGLSVVLLVLAAVLTPRELGVLAIGTLVVTLASQVQDLGLSDALTYRRDRVDEAARTALTLTLVGGLVSTAVVVAASGAVAGFFSEPDARGVVVGLAGVLVLNAAALVPVGLLTRSLDFRRRAVPQTVPGLVGSLLTVVLALTGHGVAALVVGQLVGAVVNVVLAFVVGPAVRPGWDRAVARELLAYSLPLLAAGLAHMGQLNVDYVLVGRLLSSAALGVYSLAYRLATLPYLALVQVVNGAAYPLYCRLEDPRERAQAFRRVFGVVLLGTVPLVTGLLAFAPSVTLLGAKWLPAVPALRGLAVYCLLFAVSETASVCLKACGRTDLVLATSVLHLVLLGGALLLVLPDHGLVAVGVVQAVVAGVLALVNLLLLRRELPTSWEGLAGTLAAPLTGAAALAAVALASLQVPGLHAEDSFVPVTLRAVVAVGAYAVVVVAVDRASLVRVRDVLAGRA
ncbi:MAG: tuaB [Frankiales bacterium]|nr:tuaB [Frankiales bacterium]